MSAFAVVNCSELVTLAGPARARVREEMRNLGVIRDGVMIVRDGLISYAGPRVRVDSEIEIVDAGNKVVMPGFVDAHTHPVFAGNRADEFEKRCAGVTYQEIAAQGGGIRSTVRKTRAAGEEELIASAARHACWFLEGGTTTIEAKSGYGLTLEDELKLLRVVRHIGRATPLRPVPTFLGAHEIPEEYEGHADDYIQLVAETMLPAVADEKLAEFCDVFCESKVFNIA